jgi:UDP-N-acetylmuramoyl-tripeptide--D-alanyl-D-alanine ligase
VANPMVCVTYNGLSIHSHLIGIYNAHNINAAIAIGHYFKVDDAAIKTALENYIPENNRSQLIQKNGNEIILDAYNANPSSMHAAIANFIQLQQFPKIAVLGDMFELGTESPSEHGKVVAQLENETKITVYFVGKDFYDQRLAKSHLHFFETYAAFVEALQTKLPTNSLLLIKGSRGMALEKTLDLF